MQGRRVTKVTWALHNRGKVAHERDTLFKEQGSMQNVLEMFPLKLALYPLKVCQRANLQYCGKITQVEELFP